MKICCFCEIWGTGGIESFLLNMLEHMDRSGLEIDIVAEKKTSDLYMPRVGAMGLGFKVLSGSTRNLRKNLAAFQVLLQERKYDVVHLNIYQALSLLYARYAKRAGVPVRIAHAHSYGLRPSVTRQLKLFLHRVSKNTFGRNITGFWACSGKAADFMFPKGISYQFIPNGINIDRFIFNLAIREKIRLKLGVQNCYVMGNVGRLSSQKNQTFLLDVLMYLRQKCPEAVLLLIGEGEERVRLKEKAKRLSLSDKVIFYGTSEDVPHLLWAMDVFVFPSCFEGLGIAAVEAQAAGLPVICSDRVPGEAEATELVEFMLLESGPQVWAEAVLSKRGMVRKDLTLRLERAGYSAVGVAENIKKLYLGRE